MELMVFLTNETIFIGRRREALKKQKVYIWYVRKFSYLLTSFVFIVPRDFQCIVSKMQ